MIVISRLVLDAQEWPQTNRFWYQHPQTSQALTDRSLFATIATGAHL